MDSQTTKNQFHGYTLESLSFERASRWDDREPGRFKATARLTTATKNLQDVRLVLDDGIVGKIMTILMPIVSEHAAIAAQQLADDTKRLANDLSDHVVQQITAANREEVV